MQASTVYARCRTHVECVVHLFQWHAKSTSTRRGTPPRICAWDGRLTVSIIRERLIAINAVSLVCAILANLCLLLTMARHMPFTLAQPMAIIAWFASCSLLVALIGAAAVPSIHYTLCVRPQSSLLLCHLRRSPLLRRLFPAWHPRFWGVLRALPQTAAPLTPPADSDSADHHPDGISASRSFHVQ